MHSREAIMQALFALVSGAAEFVTALRRLRLWNDVAPGEKQAIFMCERDDVYTNGKNYLQIVEMNVDLLIYIDAGTDQSIAPITVLDPLLDAADAALAPNPVTRRQTLGGLVSHCWIEGKIMKDPGDIDSDWIAVIPVKTLATVYNMKSRGAQKEVQGIRIVQSAR
jgi:hypothetical protein